jgi:hypothetical protein
MRPDQILRQKAHTAARLLRRAREVRRASGIRATGKFLVLSMKGFSLSGRQRPAAPSEFDREHGVDTSGVVRIASMQIDSPNYVYGVFYKGSDPATFHAALRRFALPFEKFTFIDMGSGKGRVLLLASDYPFRSVIGVEFGADLHRVAEANIRRYQGINQRCHDVRSVCQDAAAYEFPAHPLLVYFYEPFESPVLERVVRRLGESYAAAPREIIVLYHAAPKSSILGAQASLREKIFTNGRFMMPCEAAGDEEHSVYATAEAVVFLRAAVR